MKNQITGLITSTFGLVALYLILKNGANASKLITAGGTAGVRIYKTLQGR